MAKYRRIPKEIEAIVFHSEDYFEFKNGNKVENGKSDFFEKIEYSGHENKTGYFRIVGENYSPTVMENDYLILNEDGSVFVLDEKAFFNVYEEVQ